MIRDNELLKFSWLFITSGLLNLIIALYVTIRSMIEIETNFKISDTNLIIYYIFFICYFVVGLLSLAELGLPLVPNRNMLVPRKLQYAIYTLSSTILTVFWIGKMVINLKNKEHNISEILITLVITTSFILNSLLLLSLLRLFPSLKIEYTSEEEENELELYGNDILRKVSRIVYVIFSLFLLLFTLYILKNKEFRVKGRILFVFYTTAVLISSINTIIKYKNKNKDVDRFDSLLFLLVGLYITSVLYYFIEIYPFKIGLQKCFKSGKRINLDLNNKSRDKFSLLVNLFGIIYLYIFTKAF